MMTGGREQQLQGLTLRQIYETAKGAGEIMLSRDAKPTDPKRFTRMVSTQLASQFTDAELARLSPTFARIAKRAAEAGKGISIRPERYAFEAEEAA